MKLPDLFGDRVFMLLYSIVFQMFFVRMDANCIARYGAEMYNCTIGECEQPRIKEESTVWIPMIT